MNSSLRLLFLLAALVLAGCSTIDSRIREKAAVFDQLPLADQVRIRQGIIAVGFTPDMVYLALGKPDRVYERAGPNGHTIAWRYNSYYERYEGTYAGGYRRFAYWDPRLQAYRIHYEPAYVSVYSEHQAPYIRVTFKDGRITVIEQTKQ